MLCHMFAELVSCITTCNWGNFELIRDFAIFKAIFLVQTDFINDSNTSVIYCTILTTALTHCNPCGC